MTLLHPAVFLSYASQDADAARRICDAFRTAGLEVWFDQSELRGGDAWDASIRKQVKECAVFVPIISANTNARSEGYFRREWNLAVQRMLDMADDQAFLLPVVIDETSEPAARVPERFRERQWSRLAGGETPAALAELVRAMLDGAAASRAAPSRDSRPANLPAQATPLVGRDRELAEIVALLRREDVRCVTLTGPGGTGKTRLALYSRNAWRSARIEKGGRLLFSGKVTCPLFRTRSRLRNGTCEFEVMIPSSFHMM